MSVFTVRLHPSNRDSSVAADPAYNSTTGKSIQRTMEVTGPNLTRRILADGETFTSTNYWKRFAPISEGGTQPNDVAIIHIVSDDGTPWSDSNPNSNRFARVHSLTVSALTGFNLAANQIDVLGTYGGVATFTQITTDETVNVRLNSSSSADFSLAAGTQTFDNGDLPVTSLAFSNLSSGASDATVTVILTIEIQSND